MMRNVTFYIPGDPKGKARPRVIKGHAYTPKETVIYENWVKQCFLDQVKDWPVTDAEIDAHIVAIFSIPKSTSKKQRALMMAGKIHPTKTPDTDNIAKAILDSLNKIAYTDDSHVVSLLVTKRYDEDARVIVSLTRKE